MVTTTDSPTLSNPEVLAFYRSLPFNYWGSANKHADQIRRLDQLSSYKVLGPLLRKGTRLLDVGCGTGWCSLTAAHYYRCDVTGIDFNEVAIERARETAGILNVPARFLVADLFQFEADRPYDVVISLGVLHHTNDCLGAVRHLAVHHTDRGGHLFLGLYHRHGRRAFLEHFQEMKAAGASEAEMLARYRQLHSSLADDAHATSWFRDQVLHPHETQHTLEELVPVLEQAGMTLIATSINGFEALGEVAELVATEQRLEQVGRQALAQGRYFPGFFVILARKL